MQLYRLKIPLYLPQNNCICLNLSVLAKNTIGIAPNLTVFASNTTRVAQNMTEFSPYSTGFLKYKCSFIKLQLYLPPSNTTVFAKIN